METAQAGWAMTMDADVTETEITVAVDVAVNNHDFAAGEFPLGTPPLQLTNFTHNNRNPHISLNKLPYNVNCHERSTSYDSAGL